MRPFDHRLLRAVPAIRRDLVLLALGGAGVAFAIIAAAYFLATALTAAADLRFDGEATAGFVIAFATRALLTSGCGAVAARMAAITKASLRDQLIEAVGERGPSWLVGQRAGELATLTGRGLDALDGYFTGYLPQLVLGVTVPIAVLGTLAVTDLTSAIVVLCTLPLIPVFGILIGRQTAAATERQWSRLKLLGGHFLDMVAGLPTLRAFGRAEAQVEAVRRMADEHRVATMRTLRVAFLSALVLELIGTISVALVAVPVGLRLLDGGLALATALLVLLLTPEAYAPLRAAGTRFHASMEGLTALGQAFTLLEGARTRTGNAAPPPLTTIEFVDVCVDYERGPALRDVNLIINAGDRIALTGPSGGGKSTLIALLLGFVEPTSGRVLIDGVDLAALDLAQWRRRIAWVPQRAHLFAASLAANIALGSPDADRASIESAAHSAALTEVIAALPDGLDTQLGERGHGLSSGERQRLALARAFLRAPDASLFLLDEPTARLDGRSEEAVLTATTALVAGRTALLVAHRPALLDVATRVLCVEAGAVREGAFA
ncbi:ATP-binding cassette subfamily C protein CydD [Allocatelliglobosispora scoriae]|uniref:ATP-binding cassette subfamily C protein CydD n=1 Tax=Allocatelliglobosispora scoriae TaxID=643052 RepID=A0A841BMV8_9ACTN|nr:thiol reductant ABC exporter subunit CydD [Allocatelliglobosispora scoriae]MBB5870407.1 ATP-binding cassette subfamily C protein CydD [Allocatelliglobosispora scoriae]